MNLRFLPAGKSFRLLKRHYAIERNDIAVIYNVAFNRVSFLKPNEWSWSNTLPKLFTRNDMISFIHSALEYGIDKRNSVDLLKKLYAENLIVEDTFNESEYILSKYTFLRNSHVHITTLMILPTMRCNFDCDYCVLKHHSVVKDLPDIDLGIAKNAIRMLLTQSPDVLYENKRVLFLGGEPLLRFDLIRKLTDYAIDLSIDQKTHRPSFAISTNGYLLNRSMIDFFSFHDYHIAISIDDIPRSDSADNESMKCSRCVLKKIAMLNDSGCPFAMSITINHSNYRRLSSILDYYYREHSVKRFILNLPIGYDSKIDSQGIDNRSLMGSLRDFYDYIVDNNIFEFELDRRVLLLERDANALGKNCVACGHQVVLRPDGMIFPCPAYANTNSNSAPLPETFDDLKENKIWRKWSRRQHLRHKYCVLHCNSISYCTQGCPYHCDNISHNINLPYSFICDFNRLIMPYILVKYVANHRSR